MGRIIFVGDEKQAIYGFAGADSDSVARIKSEFNCEVMPLSVTYRCPKAIVAEANKIFPDKIQAHESAPEGKVSSLDCMSSYDALFATNLTVQDAILCRKTAPIVELAFVLIRRGVACHVEGRDIGQGLLKLASRWKVTSVRALEDRLLAYKDREVAKLVAKGKETAADALADRVETLLVIAEGCNSVQDVKNKILGLFQDTNGQSKPSLTLATVHRSKGREWGRVFILGYRQFMPSKMARQAWQMEQERNLQYVAITRAKAELFYVDVAAK